LHHPTDGFLTRLASPVPKGSLHNPRRPMLAMVVMATVMVSLPGTAQGFITFPSKAVCGVGPSIDLRVGTPVDAGPAVSAFCGEHTFVSWFLGADLGYRIIEKLARAEIALDMTVAMWLGVHLGLVAQIGEDSRTLGFAPGIVMFLPPTDPIDRWGPKFRVIAGVEYLPQKSYNDGASDLAFMLRLSVIWTRTLD
jgi:hypothetical protein